jgi:hypothetical protein
VRALPSPCDMLIPEKRAGLYAAHCSVVELACNTISRCWSAAFSASSRHFDLNGEAIRVRKKHNRAFIAADFRRLRHIINKMEFSVYTDHSFPPASDRDGIIDAMDWPAHRVDGEGVIIVCDVPSPSELRGVADPFHG